MLLLLFCLQNIHAQNITDNTANKNSHYEGSVSLTYCWPLNAGIETIHGARFDKTGLFIGGIAGGMMGAPMGSYVYAGALPRWYMYNWGKGELYISCAVMFGNLTPYRGSAEPSSMMPQNNYTGGVSVMPEFGVGFTLKNGDAIDLAIRCHNIFLLYDSYKDYYIAKGRPYECTYITPGLSIGYRF